MNRAMHPTAISPRRALLDYGRFSLLAGLLTGLLFLAGHQLGYPWQWYRVPRFLFTWEAGLWKAGPLLKGLWVTLEISALSLVLTILLGLVTALMSLSASFTARGLARAYLEAIRNTPLLIQIFLVYFVVAPVLELSAFASAVLALTLFEGSYAAEILRAAIVSLPRGQAEAAYSLGLSPWATYRDVLLPQAIRRCLPSLAGQGVSLVKDSSLVSTIAIYDLTMEGQKIVAETFLAFEIWFTVAGIYLVLTFGLSAGVRLLERRLHTLPFRPDRGLA